MSFLLPILASVVLTAPAAEPEKPAPTRYVHLVKDKYLTDSEITTTKASDGSTAFVSRNFAPPESVTLTLHYDATGKLTTAEAVLDGKMKKSATLTFGEKKGGTFVRVGPGKNTEFFKDLPENPVVATSPGWSEFFQLVKRYDTAKGGKQEFPGAWIHPADGMKTLTYAVQREGDDTIKVLDKDKKEQALKLDRFRVSLPAGDFRTWVDPMGRVVRIAPVKGKETPVILEGFEEATKDLSP
jgi:hypothetical protein